jgi:hypothetical protein
VASRPRWLWVGVAAVFIALALLLALPSVPAVAQFLGLDRLVIFYGAPTQTPTPIPTPNATLVPGAAQVPLTATPVAGAGRATRVPTKVTPCCETTLEEARNAAEIKLVAPPDMAPSKVHYQQVFNDGEQVIMVFGDPADPEFTLFQAHRFVYGKLLNMFDAELQTVIGEAQVNGTRALWITGAPHVLVTMNRRGEPNYEVARTVDANTLVWETGNADTGVIYRLETRLGLEEAVRFAESLREIE